MPTPRVLILRAPGTNCDLETAFAFERAGALTELLHINQLLATPERARDFQILCLPGGFSYGDDIAAGRILATQLDRHLHDTLYEFKASDKLILGICNGFQVLLKTGLLLDDLGPSAATLTWNDSGKFEDRWVHLRAQRGPCVFLQDVDSLYLPVAHAEGKFVARDHASLGILAAQGRLALRYTAGQAPDGGTVSYPANPNGSEEHVAGLCDATGRVFGLMPHPERHIDPTHHPQWTRRGPVDEGDGLLLFRNAVRYFADRLQLQR